LRAQQPSSDFKEYISTITSVKALDEYTVEIKTKDPNPILLNQLSNIFVMSKKWATENFAIVPQNWDASQETFSAVNAMGTGPFKITLREPNTKTVFKKNKNGGVKFNTILMKYIFFQLLTHQQELRHYYQVNWI